MLDSRSEAGCYPHLHSRTFNPAKSDAIKKGKTKNGHRSSVQRKSSTSRNALKLGLFSLRNIVQPDEEAFYNDYSTALWRELHPRGPSQETQAAEILRASWRLHRIANAEASLRDLSATI